MNEMTDHDIMQICDQLNDITRKCLGRITPAEVFRKKVAGGNGTHTLPSKAIGVAVQVSLTLGHRLKMIKRFAALYAVE